jgi:hypothetical protein
LTPLGCAHCATPGPVKARADIIDERQAAWAEFRTTPSAARVPSQQKPCRPGLLAIKLNEISRSNPPIDGCACLYASHRQKDDDDREDEANTDPEG